MTLKLRSMHVRANEHAHEGSGGKEHVHTKGVGLGSKHMKGVGLGIST